MDMQDIHEGSGPNRILNAFPDDIRHRLVDSAELVYLPVWEFIYTRDQPMEHVYFPLDCVVSFVSMMRDGTTVEVGTVGNEGMVGLPIYLGTRRMRFEASSQVPGSTLRVSAKAFEAEPVTVRKAAA